MKTVQITKAKGTQVENYNIVVSNLEQYKRSLKLMGYHTHDENTYTYSVLEYTETIHTN